MRYLIMTCCLAFAGHAHADLTLMYEDDAGAQAMSLYIKGQQLRMEGDDGAMLFDAAKREITVLESRERRYAVIDEAAIDRLASQMREAIAMMERMGVNPESMGLAGLPERLETRDVRTGETRTVRGHRCEVVHHFINDELATITCVAPHGQLGVSDADWRTLNAMFEMLTKMATDMLPAGMMSIDMTPAEGVAVEATDANGRDRQVLADVDASVLDASLFEVPSGWRRMRLDSPGG
jgi:hypothetical protein